MKTTTIVVPDKPTGGEWAESRFSGEAEKLAYQAFETLMSRVPSQWVEVLITNLLAHFHPDDRLKVCREARQMAKKHNCTALPPHRKFRWEER